MTASPSDDRRVFRYGRIEVSSRRLSLFSELVLRPPPARDPLSGSELFRLSPQLLLELADRRHALHVDIAAGIPSHVNMSVVESRHHEATAEIQRSLRLVPGDKLLAADGNDATVTNGHRMLDGHDVISSEDLRVVNHKVGRFLRFN